MPKENVETVRRCVEFWSQDMSDYAREARADGQPGTFRPDPA